MFPLQVMNAGKEAINILSSKLGNQVYFFGDRYTNLTDSSTHISKSLTIPQAHINRRLTVWVSGVYPLCSPPLPPTAKSPPSLPKPSAFLPEDPGRQVSRESCKLVPCLTICFKCASKYQESNLINTFLQS